MITDHLPEPGPSDERFWIASDARGFLQGSRIMGTKSDGFFIDSVNENRSLGFFSRSEAAKLKEALDSMEQRRNRLLPPKPNEPLEQYLARVEKEIQSRRVIANEALEARAKEASEAARQWLLPASCACRQRLSLDRLSRFADWFPLDLRKRLKALAGDYDAEIVRLHAEGRSSVARWNKCLAWCYAICYVARGPFDRIASLFVKGNAGT